MRTEDYIAENSIEVEIDEFLADPEAKAAFEDAVARSDLAELMRKARKDSNLSQAEVAEMMGTTQSAVSDFERGETDPQLSTIQRYARAIGSKVRIVISGQHAVTSIISPYSQVTAISHYKGSAQAPTIGKIRTYNEIRVS